MKQFLDSWKSLSKILTPPFCQETFSLLGVEKRNQRIAKVSKNWREFKEAEALRIHKILDSKLWRVLAFSSWVELGNTKTGIRTELETMWHREWVGILKKIHKDSQFMEASFPTFTEKGVINVENPTFNLWCRHRISSDFVFCCFLFCSVGDQTQGFMYAR